LDKVIQELELILTRIKGRIEYWEFHKESKGRISLGGEKYEYKWDVIDSCEEMIAKLQDVRDDVRYLLRLSEDIAETCKNDDLKIEEGLRLG